MRRASRLQRAGSAGPALLRIRCDRGGGGVSGALPGLRAEDREVAQLPSKAPYSKRFEDEAGKACEGASARQVARRMGLAEGTARAIDLRYLERWEAGRRKPSLRQIGVDEI